ncbi:hypothetical protein IJ579_04970 [bacterium]|nr:hypothetical protein [bacterium]
MLLGVNRYKANRHSGARTCEPVCVAVSKSNQIDRCRNKFGMTAKFPTHGVKKVKFLRTKHYLSGDKSRLGLLPQHVKFPSPLVGEGATYTITPPLKGLPPFETLESKQSGELFARGNTDPRHASRDVTYPRFICLAN